jgi:hypothetical protein
MAEIAALSDAVAEALEAWLRERGTAPGPLLLNQNNEARMSARSIARTVAKAGSRVGLSGMSVGDLRASAKVT